MAACTRHRARSQAVARCVAARARPPRRGPVALGARIGRRVQGDRGPTPTAAHRAHRGAHRRSGRGAGRSATPSLVRAAGLPSRSRGDPRDLESRRRRFPRGCARVGVRTARRRDGVPDARAPRRLRVPLERQLRGAMPGERRRAHDRCRVGGIPDVSRSPRVRGAGAASDPRHRADGGDGPAGDRGRGPALTRRRLRVRALRRRGARVRARRDRCDRTPPHRQPRLAVGGALSRGSRTVRIARDRAGVARRPTSAHRGRARCCGGARRDGRGGRRQGSTRVRLCELTGGRPDRSRVSQRDEPREDPRFEARGIRRRPAVVAHRVGAPRCARIAGQPRPRRPARRSRRPVSEHGSVRRRGGGLSRVARDSRADSGARASAYDHDAHRFRRDCGGARGL